MVQFITHCNERFSYVDSARIALEGGCRWIQLRMKDSILNTVYDTAREIKSMCQKYRAVFIIDDYVDIAKEIQADGVHLGKNDMPVFEARKILGDNFIIGGTANTFDDVKALYEAGANYIGCGPFRYTTTKNNLAPILGLEGYRHILSQMKVSDIKIPLVAIGGITDDDIPDIMGLGFDGIALSSSVLNAENPINKMNKIITLTESWKN